MIEIQTINKLFDWDIVNVEDDIHTQFIKNLPNNIFLCYCINIKTNTYGVYTVKGLDGLHPSFIYLGNKYEESLTALRKRGLLE